VPKICTEEECENPVFGGEKCKFHQWKRADKKKPSGKKTYQQFRPISINREKDYKIYRPKRDAYMKEHPVCEVEGCCKPSNDLHHKNGRNGARLYDETYFMAICRDHHIQIDNDTIWARENGYLI